MDTAPGRRGADAPAAAASVDPVQSDAPVPDPAALATAWLPRDGEDRMLMTVSTIDADGFPRSRTVRLTGFDGERFLFHTDALSRKAAELAADPRVALTMLWPGFTRQIVVQGTAAVASDAEIADAYAQLPPSLKRLAWLNTAENAALPRLERERRWAEFAASHPEPAQPAGWVGYAVRPRRLLFWASSPAAASRRIEYTRSASGWRVRHLPG